MSVLALGWTMGGTIGLGTVLYALSNGPLLQFFMPMFELPETPTQATKAAPETSAL